MKHYLPALTIPDIFRDCPNIYTPKDQKYTNCTIPHGASPCKMLEELHEAKNFRQYFLATVPLILSSFAIIFNIVFGIVTLILWKTNKLSSKQRYTFLLSRTVSTVIALILFYIVLIEWKIGGFQYTSATVFILVASLTFLTHSGTYLAMTTILYMAIVHPMQHRYLVTCTRCFISVCVIWLVSIAFSLCIGLFGATLFYPETAPIRCPFSTCQWPFAISVVCLLSVFFVTVIAFYTVMLYRMHRRRFKIARRESDRSLNNIRTMNRLAFNLITFAVASMPILIVAIIATVNLESLASLGLGGKSPCKTYENGNLFWQVEVLASIAAIVWVLTMILDPPLNTYIDKHFRKASLAIYLQCITKLKNRARCTPAKSSQER